MLHKPYIVPPAPIPFTQAGYQKLTTDLAKYQKLREEVVIRLQTAREMGDLSENGAYKAAKFELGGIDRELRRLKYLLQYGQVKETNKTNIIDFGNTITLKNNSQEITFMLVGTHESHPPEKLSLQSPFGQAVLGKKVGDQIAIAAPSGTFTYTITKVF